MIEKIIPDFSIEQIANSGQCFRINPTKDRYTWQVVAFEKFLKITQQPGSEHVIFDCSAEEFKNVWENYFDLKRDYRAIKNLIIAQNDPYLSAAVRFGYGLRMLKQDLWEMVISSITSQQNNIARIKQLIEKLCALYDGKFPPPEVLATFSEKFYQSLGFGYRAKYIFHIAQSAKNGEFDMAYLKQLPYKDAVKYLKNFPGIGEKVANCIALFGLHIFDAFPVDVWIKRIITEKYAGRFDLSHFPGIAGIVQQYMFFYERNKASKNTPN